MRRWSVPRGFLGMLTWCGRSRCGGSKGTFPCAWNIEQKTTAFADLVGWCYAAYPMLSVGLLPSVACVGHIVTSLAYASGAPHYEPRKPGRGY